jgi:hypothetical protein
MMDASILLPPTGTPLTGIDFIKRLPCGEVERARKVSLQPKQVNIIYLPCNKAIFLGGNVNCDHFPMLHVNVTV